MLGKLFRYDFKAQYKIHCGTYLVILFTTLAAFALMKLQKAYPQAEVFQMFSAFTLVIFVLSLIGVIAVTFIYSILHYRKNLLKDEGYLMHTLPVAPWELHFSKMFSTVVWYVVDAVVIGAAISIVTEGFRWLRVVNGIAQITFGMVSDEKMEILGAELVGVEVPGQEMSINIAAMIGFAAYLLIAVICGLSQIYMCLRIGYTAYSSRDLMAFVAYMLTYVLNQVLSVIGVVIVSLMDFGSVSAIFGAEEYAAELVNPMKYVAHTMTFAVILSIVMIVGYNLVSLYISKNKLNLE